MQAEIKERDSIDSPYTCDNCPDNGTDACLTCIVRNFNTMSTRYSNSN